MKKKADSVSNTLKINIDTHQKTIQEISRLIEDKILHIQEIIKNTIVSMNQYKKYEIFSNSDVVICINTMVELYEKTRSILIQIANIPKIQESATKSTLENTVIKSSTPTSSLDEINTIIDELQQIIDRISIVICGFGTKYMADLFFISFGSEFNERLINNELWKAKSDLILNHISPIGYKTIHWKQSKSRPRESIDVSPDSAPLCRNKITDDTIQIELSNQYECFDVDTSTKSLYVKLYGVRVVIHNEKTQKTLIIQGIVDDIVLDCMSNKYVVNRKRELLENIPSNTENYDVEIMTRIIETLTLKDILIYSNADIYKRYMSVMSEVSSIKHHKLNATIKNFLEMDICSQRQMLIHLLIYNKEDDIQYITYLLYDLITDSTSAAADSVDQMLIYESFPWKIKLYFKDTMKNTIKYTKEMVHKYDINRVTLEQQIYVMKVPENVKEKAMLKLKEIKGKSDDFGAKSKQYLEGLLKIPFGVYCEEPILKKVKTIQSGFLGVLSKSSPVLRDILIHRKERYTTTEMMRYIEDVRQYISGALPAELEQCVSKLTMKQLTAIISYISSISKSRNIKPPVVKTREEKNQAVVRFLKDSTASENITQIYDIITELSHDVSNSHHTMTLTRTVSELEKTRGGIHDIKTDLEEITKTLDDSIYGHSHAKDQILKIIGQWMTGEQSGYCFGFEGSPGIGKTSLAKKGLANCLKDGSKSRPFAFIALGGSCNGSTLEGHSYTYVNSTWGRIADILMDSNCMNPIIYIDELDKVSKTEHGKEIIGILTHLIDTTQNTGFQDKYFSGIDLDLSKALFIFSYNDPAQIDKILLDRIHRIRFENLSLIEKIVIVRKYILPEINRKMGFVDSIVLSDEVIEYIIETYTLESGVRKLKEVIFDLFGEINIELLKGTSDSAIQIPFTLSVDHFESKYLSKYDKIREKKIHSTPEIGVINGLWASVYGKGGIIPIQTMLFPSTTFLDLKLTGLQGDVMKESMNVAKTLAWNMLDNDSKREWLKNFEETKCQGLHIHCPDGAVSKDGPSAGTAITLAIYSLLAKRSIHNTVAITGEINLQGYVTEIGGLEDKILGGMKAGVKKFLFPKSNVSDFDKFYKKYGENPAVKQIDFVPVSSIMDTFPHIFSE